MTSLPSIFALATRSAAFARTMAQRVPLLPFRKRGVGMMSAARALQLTMLATALAVLAVAGALFALYVHPAYAQETSAPAQPTGLSATASHDQVVLTWDDPKDEQHHRLRDPAPQPREHRRGRVHRIGGGYRRRRDHLHRRQHSS